MTLHEKRLAVMYGRKVTLHFNGWDISGRPVDITSDDKVQLNGKYYNLRACREVSSDYDRDLAIATENRIRRGEVVSA